MAEVPEITFPVEPAQAEALPAAIGGPPDAASVVGVETGLLEVEMRGLSATMVEVTTVSKEEEVRPLPPVAAADPDSLGQVFDPDPEWHCKAMWIAGSVFAGADGGIKDDRDPFEAHGSSVSIPGKGNEDHDAVS